MTEMVKLVVFVPETHTDQVRAALGEAGAGKIGNYTMRSFTSKGEGRFLPMDGARPTIGAVGTLETVDEDRIEVTCEKANLSHIVAAMKAAHPYEEVAYDLYPLINPNE